ncbi:transposase [Candidatus Synechococcus calcipolaris G9]|uniref:Transposase n=2 Tax=Synechococcus TaxID=1129 RepID=A0ABT6F1L5_9SYNE|nr:transposase [Candidatus Synechococcus calcipolaris]MDG2991729.1 transposase [Candidatus Synechococcus calcipolaris G9]
MKTDLNHDRYRIVQFYDIDSGVEYRLATNLKGLSDEEVAELYRHRWGIETLWKFLKMHLCLEKLITKSLNGVTNQIYMILIAYLILELIEIPIFYGTRTDGSFQRIYAQLIEKVKRKFCLSAHLISH